MNIDRAICNITSTEPYIIVFGAVAAADDIAIKIVIEKENVISASSVEEALHCCFASYYLFNISYSTSAIPLMLFLEQYFYKMKPSQKYPLSVKQIVDSLEKL